METVFASNEKNEGTSGSLTRVTHERGNAMFKLVKVSTAALLGVLLALTLFVSGAFAQTVNARHGSTPSTHQVITHPVSHSSTHCGGCWGGGWDGDWDGGWDGGAWAGSWAG